MNKKTITIILLITSILLISLYIISNTYSVIIEVITDNNGDEIVNKITIRDLLTDNNGIYNSTYYDVLSELVITNKEAEILIDSIPLNNALQTIINDIVSYKLHKNIRMTKNELYNLIVAKVNEDDNINDELKNKITNKLDEYIIDIYNYLYDIEVNSSGVELWFH